MKKYLKFIKKFYLPLLAIGLVALIYFGINGVRAEISRQTAKPKIAQETPSSFSMAGLDSSPLKTPNQTQAAPQETKIMVEPSPEVKNINQKPQARQKEKVAAKINAGRKAGNYFVDYTPGENAFQLLMRVAQNDVEYTDWGGDLGIFVDGIGGVRRTDKYEYCWFFYINGSLGQVGASQYQVLPNDVIEWKYGEAY